MDLEGTKFGRGPRELGGAVDLINHYKLWPHHDFFCKRSLPLSISETQYLHNVVGETEIMKGEGMELDQLFQNTSYVGDQHADIRPFDLEFLREAFKIREAEKGIPTAMLKSNGEVKDKKKHNNHKSRDKDHKKHKQRCKNRCRDKDEEKNRSGHHDFGSERLQNQQDKKRRNEGSNDLFGIQRRQKSEVTLAKHNNLKINERATLRIAR